ncbi:MAG: TIGR02757 family protein [Bacteroidota bacterium]|nr:TIGR02757 family protein [Bacteroidota bacterium]
MKKVTLERLKPMLDILVNKYNSIEFIENDPISIPHKFKKKQDIEISGFIAATFSWGQRLTIINKCIELFELMDNSPYDFIMNHKENDLKRLVYFKHRTFNYTDTLYYIHFLKKHYSMYESLEDAFTNGIEANASSIELGLVNFHNYFINDPFFPIRTKKHVSSPESKSACKRLNMFLRWMVRKDNKGVDFGIWNRIKPSQLICPCDVHVDKVGRALKLITRKQTDWQTAVELTESLKILDSFDPIKYDFALFGLGIEQKLKKLTINILD